MSKELNILDIARTIWDSRKKIILIVSLFFVLSLLFCHFSSKIYRAQANVMPIIGGGGRNTGTALLVSLMGNIPTTGASTAGALEPTANIFKALLMSQAIAERVVARLNLLPVFYKDIWNSQQQKWEVDDKEVPSIAAGADYFLNMLTVESDLETGALLVSMEAQNPKLATDCVNGLLEELDKYISEDLISSAKKNRIFIEGQVAKNIEDFLRTGKQISEYNKTKNVPGDLSNIDVDIDLNPVKNLSDAQLEMNAEYKKLLEQNRALESKFNQIKIAQVPQQVYLEYLLLKRDVLGKLTGALQQQYEIAKMDEAHDSISFQVIDYARVPVSPYKPKTFLVVTLSTFVGLFIGLFYVFFTQYIQNLKREQKHL